MKNLPVKLTFGLVALCASSFTAADTPDPATIEAGLAPAWIIELPESVQDVLVADASSATMHHFGRDGAIFRWLDSRYMSIGENGVRKVRAWDRKTPLGAYFVTDRLDTDRMHDKYGPAAFPLDYPNAWDRYNDRTGYGIWLHGVDKNDPQRPPLDTNGCLALPNDELMRLADDLIPLVTPVIVASGLEWADASDLERIRMELRIAIDQWRESVRDRDLPKYLSLYSDEFRHHDMNKTEWSSFRLQVFQQREIQDIEISDVVLLAEPAEQNLYLSRFTQVMTTDAGTITTTKRLYWRRTPASRWQIVSEGSG